MMRNSLYIAVFFSLLISGWFNVAEAIDQSAYSLQIQNKMPDGQVMRHCRVSPNGIKRDPGPGRDDRPREDYIMDYDARLSNFNEVHLFLRYDIKEAYLRMVSQKELENLFTTCGIYHDQKCDGFGYDQTAIMHTIKRGAIDNDHTYGGVSAEFLARVATANYNFPDKINYTGPRAYNNETKLPGWRAYNVDIAPGGSIVIPVNMTPPRLNVECDLYDNAGRYLSTFGFVLDHDIGSIRTYNGGDTHIDFGEPVKNQAASSITYQMNYVSESS